MDLNYISGKKFKITDTGTCERFLTYIVGERQGFKRSHVDINSLSGDLLIFYYQI